MDDRIPWVHGEARSGPRELIGVLELRADDSCRAVFAERVEVDGKCHILLVKRAWKHKRSWGCSRSRRCSTSPTALR